MKKLRKTLGDIQSPECEALMKLIETQSRKTLAAWAVDYAKNHYLEICHQTCEGSEVMEKTINACEKHLSGEKKLSEIKPLLKEARQTASGIRENPIGQASARAIATACATVLTPTNALGFLFYGAAAAAYSSAGLDAPKEMYDNLASMELKKAYDALEAASVPDEAHPAGIEWGC